MPGVIFIAVQIVTREAQHAVQLVHRPEGVDQRVVLADALAREQPRLALVPALGVDLGHAGMVAGDMWRQRPPCLSWKGTCLDLATAESLTGRDACPTLIAKGKIEACL